MDTITVSGSYRDVGRQIGQIYAPVIAEYLEQSSDWLNLQRWKGSSALENLQSAAQDVFPDVWEELTGMAEGLHMDVTDLFLWNCRGDLLHSTSDGCTTVSVGSPSGGRVVGHNEDGDPFLYQRSILVNVHAIGSAGFISFTYPGSLVGHSFAASRAGFIQTINNLRIRSNPTDSSAAVPRMFLARQALSCSSLQEAVDLICSTTTMGGFHYTLCGRDNDEVRMVSVESTGATCTVVEGGALPFSHTNHTVHPSHCGSPAQVSEIITDNSNARYTSTLRLLGEVELEPSRSLMMDKLVGIASSVLGDIGNKEGSVVPILRSCPDDPDEENTLATVMFSVLPSFTKDNESEESLFGDPIEGKCGIHMSVYDLRRSTDVRIEMNI